jgi:hypothetical protein
LLFLISSLALDVKETPCIITIVIDFDFAMNPVLAS